MVSLKGVLIVKLKTISTLTAGILSISLLSGCSAVSTFVHHRNIESESKMSQSIFLEPIAKKDRSVYIQVTNTSGNDFSKFKPYLAKDLEEKGWTVVDDVDQPHHAMIQVNLLQFGKAQSEQAVWASLGNGFGSALTGGLAGVAAAYLTNSNAIGIGAGVGTGSVSWLANEMYSNVIYSAMTDVQISIESKGKVKQVTHSNLSQGTQSQEQQTVETQSNWMKYRTRIGSVVQKANLDADEAMPPLAAQQAKEISGIFA